MHTKTKYRMNKIVACTLALMLIISIVPTNTVAAYTQPTIGGSSMGMIVAQGDCGRDAIGNATWFLDSNGKLFIMGSGRIQSGWDGYESKVKEVIFIGEFTEICGFTFQNCTNLKSITVPSGVKKIGCYTFDKCTNLKSVTIPEGVTLIDQGLFENCTSLVDVVIPETVKSIGDFAFNNCTSLESIVIPESTKTMLMGSFKDCNSLDSIYFFSKDCYIEIDYCIPAHTTIYGYTGSTAEAFATKYNRKFFTLH